MNLCANCKHFTHKFDLCHSPENGISPIDGKPRPMMAAIQRSSCSLLFDNLCGPDGSHFEQAPIPHIDPVDCSNTTTVSPSGFVSIVRQYFSKWRKS